MGLRAIMEGDTSLGDGAELDDLSVLPAGQQVPAGEGWLGSPAQRVRQVVPAGPLRPVAGPGAGYLVAQLAAIALLLLVPTVASLPIIALLYESVARFGAGGFLAEPHPVIGALRAAAGGHAGGHQAPGGRPPGRPARCPCIASPTCATGWPMPCWPRA